MSRILIGLQGPEPSELERRYLARGDVAGVVLFGRNFADIDQIRALNSDIRSINGDALIAIDQEGGRVQRIGEPCSALPPLRTVGACWAENADDALDGAFRHGWLMASEMLALGVDISFAPVLDLDRGSPVIGDRSLHPSCDGVKELGRAYIKGMGEAGMAATGKHFPGHGLVSADTHHEVAVDERELDDIAIEDLRPYSVAMKNGLDAVMMAHVIYPRVCSQPAGYSPIWCREILRERMRFDGVIFSDDLGMRAAEGAGDFEQRYRQSIEAGCDLVLVCRPDDVAAAMAAIPESERVDDPPHRRLLARRRPVWEELVDSPDREMNQLILQTLED